MESKTLYQAPGGIGFCTVSVLHYLLCIALHVVHTEEGLPHTLKNYIY